MKNETKKIITGGGGFVGKALGRKLKAQGAEVVSLSRGNYPELRLAGIRTRQVDITHGTPEQLARHFFGADTVFHVAAKVDMWGRYEDFFRTNVVGTRNVIKACKIAGVTKLIYTSSPSVIADGTDLCGIDESYPYPDHFEAFYPQTKAIAEQEVLAANSETLFTCSLRPHLIWGPGDTNLVPLILERASAGRLVQVGSGKNRVDLSYIDDCVAAHLNAAHALGSNPESRGQVYFISQGEPVNMWWWINEVLVRNDLPRLSRKIPTWLANRVAALSEAAVKFLPGEREPFLTRFLVSEMATSHYFSIDKAKRLLGYKPQWRIQAALDETFGSSGGIESDVEKKWHVG